MTYFYFREHYHTLTKTKFWQKHKTAIEVLLCIYELLVLLKYIFYLPETLFLFLVSFCQILKSIIIFLVCLFFATKASKQGDDRSKKLTASLRLGFYVFLVVFTGIFAY